MPFIIPNCHSFRFKTWALKMKLYRGVLKMVEEYFSPRLGLKSILQYFIWFFFQTWANLSWHLKCLLSDRTWWIWPHHKSVLLYQLLKKKSQFCFHNDSCIKSNNTFSSIVSRTVSFLYLDHLIINHFLFILQKLK